ncbi:hypothetical protein PR048_002007 [Dryococelus australis]|uniref:DDE Tnp4 domain-containing protein n=1 Tax=Dryococelus australis TaxID=614101 RepID=A0ABQ9ILH9_9NEOP|nr:hypothetical protein PR048_002007 [Dryococelus australis]
MMQVVFGNNTQCKPLKETLKLPAPRPLPGGNVDVPFVIVVDDAFPLSPNIMKRFAMTGLAHERRIYNYRVSRARRTIVRHIGTAFSYLLDEN